MCGYTRRALALRLSAHYFFLSAVGVVIGLAAAQFLNVVILKNILMYEFSTFDASWVIFAIVSSVSLVTCFLVCFFATYMITSGPPAEKLR